MYAYDNKVDPGILMLIGIILLTLSIPMAIVVILLYIFTLGASITGLYKGVSKTLNMITLIISILAIIISIIGTYHYFDTTIELIDTISRLG